MNFEMFEFSEESYPVDLDFNIDFHGDPCCPIIIDLRQESNFCHRERRLPRTGACFLNKRDRWRMECAGQGACTGRIPLALLRHRTRN